MHYKLRQSTSSTLHRGESAGSVTRTIHTVDKLHQVVPQWHYCLYTQERPAGIYCAVSVDTNNTKST